MAAFTDADAEHEPGAGRESLAGCSRSNATLVSFSPDKSSEKWYEKALIPFIYCRLGQKIQLTTR